MAGPRQNTLDSDHSSLTAIRAHDVARGIGRLFARNDIWCLPEVSLKNGRRADLMGIDAKGLIVIVEIKVARSDLLGDSKWPDYLDFCDRFFWGVPPGLDRAPLDTLSYQPKETGVIVADGYDAEIVRHASLTRLAPARRKAQVERLARLAMRRHTSLIDPHCASIDTPG
ncbi:MAG: MmcB family DNA repair protein [Erythrobacter sp.]|nr:MmcB family DNA repair protein [Erythrobacter sp.]